jgi:O-acetyl-ADP-ribose deacetylase (regulator of RNase III)
MITYLSDDLLTVTTGAIAHGCNSQGKMGAGVALAIKKKHPWAFSGYEKFCQYYVVNNGVWPPIGAIHVATSPDESLVIFNMITQSTYSRKEGRYVSYDGLDTCLEKVANYLNDHNQRVISMPKIGAGLGGGCWPVIEEIIKFRLKDFDVVIYTNEASVQDRNS